MTQKVKKHITPNLNQEFSANTLGNAIKAKRSQANLRLEDAASLCGVAKQTLMNIEHGKTTVKLDSILRICRNLGIKLFIQPWIESSEQDDEWQ